VIDKMVQYTQKDITKFARECIDTPFRHQGRHIGVGMDCVAVAIHVAKRLEVDHSDVKGYSRIPSNGLIEKAFEEQTCITKVDGLNLFDDLQEGDILLMRFTGEPQHVAIYSKEFDTIIHGYQDVGKVCEHTLDSIWRKRILMVYRFNKVSSVI